MIQTAYRRWLGFLQSYFPDDLLKPPANRITPDRVRALIEHLGAEIRQTSVANVVDNLCYAARLIAPERDWQWLATIKRRLAAHAYTRGSLRPLGPTLAHPGLRYRADGRSAHLAVGHKQREFQYRDGLILALISIWLIRRRSIEALTVSRHLEFDAAGVNILLYPEDTKAKRAESFRVPENFCPISCTI